MRWFDRNNKNHMNQEWMVGPFCLEIMTEFVHKLPKPIECDGQQCRFPVKDDLLKQILEQHTVEETINEWKKQFKCDIYTELPTAITVSPPLAEAIITGYKNYENRDKRIFHLHEDKKQYPFPDKPADPKCRFCPSDPTLNCTSWFHGNLNNNNKKKKKGVKRKLDGSHPNEPVTKKVKIGNKNKYNNAITTMDICKDKPQRGRANVLNIKDVIEYQGNRAQILDIDDGEALIHTLYDNKQSWVSLNDCVVIQRFNATTK